MESVNNPKSFLFLPPVIRLLIYRYLLIPKEGYISIGERYNVKSKKRKVKGRKGIMWQYKWMISTFVAGHLPYPALRLFLCNRTIYQEAAGVFFGENKFTFRVREGEADWDRLYVWLKMIGRRNICRLKHLEIEYDSVDVRIYKGKQRFSAMAPYDLSGNGSPGFHFLEAGVMRLLRLDEVSGWFEVISPTIEQVFRKLGCSDSPLLVTMSLPACQNAMVPRLLYPEVDLQEYNPLPLFNRVRSAGTSLQKGEYAQAGARYSPKEFCIVPDLIEGYRKKYGKDTLTVQWEGAQSADNWHKTKDLLLGCGWEILHWEEYRPAPLRDGNVSFTLRLERDLTHGRV